MTGSDDALAELRRKIARLEVELEEMERRTAEVERDGIDGPTPPVGPRSRKLADELAASSIEREQAAMRRFLDGTSAVCKARVDEARSEARLLLAAARDDLSRAVQERALLVEEVIATPPPAEGEIEPAAVAAPLDAMTSVEPSLIAPAPVESGAPTDTAALASTAEADRVPNAAPGRRAALISVLMWIVGGALVVVGLAFAIIVILMLLD